MLDNLMKSIDGAELLRRAVKYLVEGIMVAIAPMPSPNTV